MLKRAQITMSPAELEAFLAEERVVTVATIGPNGRPHVMPLWYVPEGTVIAAWTFAKSQKVRNLERRAQATLQVEGGDRYEDLRGVMLECDVEIIRDPGQVTAIGLALGARYAPDQDAADPARRAQVDRQAPKRVGLRFRPTRVSSWDHRKLAVGIY